MTEEQVFEYIQQNPDFFELYPELIHQLQLNYSRANTASLIEKRMNRLQQENQQLKEQLQQHIHIAQENVALSKKVHQITLALMQCPTLDDFLEFLLNDFKALFQVEKLELYSDYFEQKDCINTFASDSPLRRFYEQGHVFYGSKNQLCLQQLCEDDICSLAVINIGDCDHALMILLQSVDSHQFSTDKDYFFIKNIQELLNFKLNDLLS